MGEIVILGPKHSGKTSVGRALAKILGRAFIDLDKLIEEETGKPPRALYQEGAAVFQKAEAASLGRALGEGPSLGHGAEAGNPAAPAQGRVIAAGGGIIDNAEAAVLLRGASSANRAALVYLDVSAKTAWGRIASEAELPPFLKTADPEETHRLLHERRAAAYQELAGFVIFAENRTIDEICDRIIESISIYYSKCSNE
jgi:shikimate kinase